jgi:hypothetical protein
MEAIIASRIDSLGGNGERGGIGPESVCCVCEVGIWGAGDVDVAKEDVREGGQRGVKVDETAVSSDCRGFIRGVVLALEDDGAECDESPNICPSEGNVDAL